MTTHALAHDSQPPGLPATRKQQDYTEDRRRYWDEFSRESTGWQPLRTFYQKRLAEIYRFLIPPGMRVLELGCSRGDLLAAVKPAYGVGIDLSPAMIAAAKSLYPELHFIEGDAHSIDLGAQFDYIICSDLVNDVWDVETLLKNLARHCSPSTRVLLNTYSRVWELPRRLAEKLGLVKKTLTQNWLMTSDVENLLYLANFELIRVGREILWPVPTPLVGTFFNKFVVKLWPFDLLALTSVLVARPLP
ncbi:MAG TPA: class I SAM-dependent methyltransferase, partial [Candidatus Acidoferrum sp.]